MAHVLIAEDEFEMRILLRKELEKNGHIVAEASNGKEAIELLENKTPDLLLLDLKMPIKTGFEVLEHMKQTNNNTPVVILSNLSNLTDIKRAEDYGAKEYLIKSNYSLEDVVTKIEFYLQNSKQDNESSTS